MILSINGIIAGRGADADALAFITAANITDNTQKTAINQLVVDLKSANIWTKMKALYPFVGGTASSHKFNLKDPRDLNAAFRLTFNGGWTHSSTGALPNGTNGFANTYFSPSLEQSLTSASFSLYSRTSGKSLTTYGGQGCYNSSTNCSYMIIRRNIDDYVGGLMWSETGGGGAFIIASSPDGRGHYTTSRINNNSLHFYKNGTSLVSNTLTQSSTSLPTNTYYLGANNGTLGGDYDNKELAFASLGSGLTGAEVTALYNAVQTFNTTLGRQV